MWDRWQWLPRLCLRDECRNVQSSQMSQIVSEVLMIGQFTPWTTRAKWHHQRSFFFIYLGHVNKRPKPSKPPNVSCHWSYLKTEHKQSKGRQCSCWVPILQHSSHLAPQNQAMFTGMHMNLAFSLAAHSLLFPKPTGIHARHITYNGSDDANRVSRLIVCSCGGWGKK